MNEEKATEEKKAHCMPDGINTEEEHIQYLIDCGSIKNAEEYWKSKAERLQNMVDELRCVINGIVDRNKMGGYFNKYRDTTELSDALCVNLDKILKKK